MFNMFNVGGIFVNRGFSMVAWAGPLAGLERTQRGIVADVTNDGLADVIALRRDGAIVAVCRTSGKEKVFSVRAALPLKKTFQGPVTVTGWEGSRCLGARNVLAGTSEAYFARMKPGRITLRWRFPGQPAARAEVELRSGPVRVLLGPKGIVERQDLPRVSSPLPRQKPVPS